MKKQLLLTILFTTFILEINAQTLFQKTFGTHFTEEGYKIKQTSDKGFIILSTFNYNSTYYIRTDSLGNKIWSKVINYRQANDIIQTSDGGFLIIGGTDWGGTNISPYAIKLDYLGNIIWQNRYGLSYINYFNSVVEDKDGTGYIIAGNDYSNIGILIKINASGSVVWKQIMTPSGTTNDSPAFIGIAQSSVDLSFFVLGSYRYGGSSGGIMVSKFQHNGNGIWAKTVSVTGLTNTFGYSGTYIKETYNNNFMISAGYSSLLYFLEMDTSGTAVNNGMRFQTASNGYMRWAFANPSVDKSMYIATSYPSPLDMLVTKINSTGTIAWIKMVGGIMDDSDNDMVSTSDGGFAMVGSTKSFSVGQADVYLVKSDSSGSFTCNGSTYPSAGVLFPTTSTTSFPCSFATTTSNISSSSFSISVVNDTSYDACGCVPPIANFNTFYPNPSSYIQDNSTWATSGYWDYGNGQTDSTLFPNPIYLVDTTYLVCHIVTNSCGSDTVCHLINYVTGPPISVMEINKNTAITIFPNPFNSKTTIAFAEEQKNTTIRISNVLGEEIKTVNFTGRQLVLEKGEMKAGIYFVQTTDEQKHICNKKIIIQ